MTIGLPSATTPEAVASILDLARCLACGASFRANRAVSGAGRLIRLERASSRRSAPFRGRNRIAADFYDGPGWRRFQPWEQGFLIFQGGVRRARMEILRHVLERTPRPVRRDGTRGRDRRR